jgi:hypothetical protein
VKIHSPNQQHATVDTAYTPRASLLQYVDGSAWEVTYYSQVLGADSEPGPWSIDRSPTDQQYVRIRNMELKVTSALSPTEEQTGRGFDVGGTATVYPTHKPNFGDMFIADIGDGRAGLFAVTEVVRKTYMRDSFAEITYVLVDQVHTKPEILSDLNRKTIKRAVFHREFLQFGQNPILLEGEFDDLTTLKKIYGDLVNFYFKDFFSIEFQTLMIPNQSMAAYDPFVTAAVLDWITPDEVPMITKVKQPVVTANRNTDSYTLWSALARMNDSYLGAAIQQCRLLETGAFRGIPEISSIYYTGIRLVACPKDARTDVDSPYDCSNASFSTSGSMLAATGLRWKDLMRYLPSTNLDGFFHPVGAGEELPELPDIVPVTIDEYYVLSQQFYDIGPGKKFASKLEVLTKQALMQEPIDKVTLLSLAKNAMKWPNLERFYYMPILFALMKVATRSN